MVQGEVLRPLYKVEAVGGGGSCSGGGGWRHTQEKAKREREMKERAVREREAARIQKNNVKADLKQRKEVWVP